MRITSADQQRFTHLLDEHKRIVFHVSRVYSRTPQQREDLAQEIVMQLWRSFAAYDPARKFSTWMYRIALNVAVSWLRQDRPAETVSEVRALYRLTQRLEDGYSCRDRRDYGYPSAPTRAI